MMRIMHVVGARPNFMKLAPVVQAFDARTSIQQCIVHTGQHYDKNMSNVFFQELNIPEPAINLGVGSGSHAQQTSQIMTRIEPVFRQDRPDWVFVYGDVNSTVAAALVCAKLHIRIAHVEAGLRSFDRTMPEEINRLVTDRVADLLFTPSVDSDRNLVMEGVASEQIHFVGNVMIDTLIRLLPKAEQRDISTPSGLQLDNPYALVTLHRPSNVDDAEVLHQFVDALDDISRNIRVVFPLHPRTRKRMAELSLSPKSDKCHLIDPVSYLDFLVLQKNAKVVITDSGGVQEETTYLGVPCLTMRTSTERPVTIEVGTNLLIGQDMRRLRQEVAKILKGNGKRGRIPLLWDGQASERIVEVVLALHEQ